MSDEDDIELFGDNRYDADEVFDDLPVQPVVSVEGVKNAVKAILRQAQIKRLPPSALNIAPATEKEVDSFTIGEIDPFGLAGDEAVKTFVPSTSERFPLLQRLYQKFLAASPTKKLVRVDTQASYDAFLDRKRAPYIAALADRMAALEKAHAAYADHGARLSRLEEQFNDHVEDGHGGIDALGEAVDRAREAVAVCGVKIPLSLQPSAQNNVKCWQDGDEILCSLRLRGPDDKVRIATSGTPADRHLEETLGYAEAANVDPVEVMGVIPALAQIFGGGALVTQLSRASRLLLARPEVVKGQVFIGVMEPASDARTLAVMSLLQMCDYGDKNACAELARIRRAGGETLVAYAEKKLTQARNWKAIQ